MDNYTYDYWTCTTPNTMREDLPNGVFAIWNDKNNKKVVVHVRKSMVVRIEYWKVTTLNTWGKARADRVRV